MEKFKVELPNGNSRSRKTEFDFLFQRESKDFKLSFRGCSYVFLLNK